MSDACQSYRKLPYSFIYTLETLFCHFDWTGVFGTGHPNYTRVGLPAYTQQSNFIPMSSKRKSKCLTSMNTNGLSLIFITKYSMIRKPVRVQIEIKIKVLDKTQYKSC